MNILNNYAINLDRHFSYSKGTHHFFSHFLVYVFMLCEFMHACVFVYTCGFWSQRLML